MRTEFPSGALRSCATTSNIATGRRVAYLKESFFDHVYENAPVSNAAAKRAQSIVNKVKVGGHVNQEAYLCMRGGQPRRRASLPWWR